MPELRLEIPLLLLRCYFCNFFPEENFFFATLHLLLHPRSAASTHLNFELTFLSRAIRDHTAPLSRVPPSPLAGSPVWAGYLEVIKKRRWLPRPTGRFIPQRRRGCAPLISRPLKAAGAAAAPPLPAGVISRRRSSRFPGFPHFQQPALRPSSLHPSLLFQTTSFF